MIGGSYDGYVQWAAAVLRPPAPKCIVPQRNTTLMGRRQDSNISSYVLWEK